MNIAFIGLPGAGKSYNGARYILEQLKAARLVVTNLPMNVEEVDKAQFLGRLVLLSNAAMEEGDFFFQYPGAVFVIDECRQFLPAGIQQKDLREGWDKLLSEHRHYEDSLGRSSQVVLLTQCTSQLPRCVRTLIEETRVYDKLNNVGLKNYFREQVYRGPQPLTEAKKADLVTSTRHKYDRAKVGRYYQTHAKAANAGNREMEQGTSFLAGSGVRYVLGALLVGAVSVSYAVSSWSSRLDEPERVAATEPGQAIAEHPPASTPARAAGPVDAAVSDGSAVSRDSSDADEREAPTVSTAYSGYWRMGDRCGALDAYGRRVVVVCQDLEGVRTVPTLALAPSKPAESNGFGSLSVVPPGLLDQ